MEIEIEKLNDVKKWSLIERGVFPPNENNDCLRIKDLFIVKRGVATGANKYFIMTKDEAVGRGITSEFLLPILPGSRHLKTDIIKCDESGLPLTNPALFLMNCKKSKEYLKSTMPQLYSYILKGEQMGVNTRYLTSKRHPWYRQEDRVTAPILCGCIATNQGGRKVIRFYRNNSKAIATNTFFMLYLKADMVNSIKESNNFFDFIFNQLKKIDPERIIANGRSYGGGLYKIEPKELENLSIDVDKKILGTYLL